MSDASRERKFLPSLSVLRSFECAARHQSFTLAAEEMNLTQSAVSRQIKELETAIGVDLFRRTGRHLELTQAGKSFARDLAVDLERIRATVVRAMAAGEASSVLRLAVLPTFAGRWLIPRLPAFEEAHPELQVHLITRLDLFDLAEENIDAALHFGTANWPGTSMTRLGAETMVAVASPSFRTRYGIGDVATLPAVPRLHLTARHQAWDDWFRAIGIEAQGAFTGKQFDQFSLVIAAAVHGLGAALIPEYLIETELAEGRLVRLHPFGMTTDNAYFLVKPAGARAPHVDAFERWLRAEAAKALKS